MRERFGFLTMETQSQNGGALIASELQSLSLLSLSRSLSHFLFLSLSFSDCAVVEVMGERERAWKANREYGI